MKRVLVANRGEIALRAIRACRAAGVESVAVYAAADAASVPVWAADRAVCIGPAAPRDSYLDQHVLIETALATGCDAVYPGYGFLAERADFAARCRDAGLTFIGPTPEVIAMMGDKAEARRTAARLGVPVVSGSAGAFERPEDALAAADEVGFPLLVKASAGGGGRGMRVARDRNACANLLAHAIAEAHAAFGVGAVYLERYFDRVRHVEVQVFGDGFGTYCHLGERDCSIQRRHQKLIEEAPCPVLDRRTRAEMTQAAVGIAEAVGYTNAGTVEFLYDFEESRYYFIEMNTRIQVEHPVTELVTGTDLVVEQLRVAAGLPLSFGAAAIAVTGHAIEWRICAEDPAQGFLPAAGRIDAWLPPRGDDIRLDSHVYEGYVVPPHYDSLLGKLVVAGADRCQALQRSADALNGFECRGVPTTLPFHRQVSVHREFADCAVHTRWVDERWPEHNRAP